VAPVASPEDVDTKAVSEHATGVHDELGAINAAWKTMTAQRVAER